MKRLSQHDSLFPSPYSLYLYTKTTMKILNFILALMFLAFAFVQINDPDPVLWILIYGAMATLAMMAIFQYYPRKFLVAILVLYLAYGVYTLIYHPGVLEWLKSKNKSDIFDDVKKMENLYIEESREFLGLMICICVLIFYVVRAFKK
ncbi:MAG TPA: transmembrane 220 family protein [Chitinophagaceae bacterium]|nr:transmembrane 220 family protein [Chitinophagaceae bacterium]